MHTLPAYEMLILKAKPNNPRPLQDTTGSRRYLCVEIPQDTIILNDRPIDYDQLYVQVLYEIREQHLPYWFSPAETRRIEEMNVKFQHVNDLESMLTACFRRPEAEEFVMPMLTRDVERVLAKTFPELKQNHGTIIKVGLLLKALNYDQKDLAQGSAYFEWIWDLSLDPLIRSRNFRLGFAIFTNQSQNKTAGGRAILTNNCV